MNSAPSILDRRFARDLFGCFSLIVVAVLFALCLFSSTGCAGMAAAQTITGVAEIAAGKALSDKSISLPDLTKLTADLAAFPQTPFPSADVPIVANLVTHLTQQRAADLKDASLIDAALNALQAFNSATPPTAVQGLAWANLQDVVIGLKQELVLANANPSLIPQ